MPRKNALCFFSKLPASIKKAKHFNPLTLFLLLLAMLLLTEHAATAQNTFPSSGNVGIGTTSPSQALEVNGVIQADGSIVSQNGTTSGGALAFGSNFNNVLDTVTNSGKITLNGAAYNYVVIPYGKIGIGTTSPAVSFDVSAKTDAMALPVGSTSQRPTGSNGQIRYNTTTNNLEAFINGSWMTIGTVTGNSSAGQLRCGGSNCANSTGSTTLDYCPYNGNVKTTASSGNYTIPSGCLTATLTSMYVGGSSGSVSDNTTYYIYLWNDAGTWVLDAETTGHATDTTTGIEIMSGDTTKTLVGMVRTNGSGKIMSGGQTNGSNDTNTVATWDNRIHTNTQCGFSAQRQVSSSSLTEINSENRCLFMSWGDALQISSRQMLYPPSGASDFVSTALSLDGTANYPAYGYMFLNVNTGTSPYSLALPPAVYRPSEGYHYTELLGSSESAVTVTYPFTQSVTNILTVQ